MLLDGLKIDAYAALLHLRVELHKQGKIWFLRQIKEMTDNSIQMCCPFHASGREAHPSAGLLLRPRGSLDAGYFHCFTCNYTADFFVMISNVFGIRDAGIYGRRWLLRNGLASKVDVFSLKEDVGGITNKEILAKIENRMTLSDKIKQVDGFLDRVYISEDEYAKYRVAHHYLYNRGISYEIQKKFDVGYDFECKDGRGATVISAVFPLKDENGIYYLVRRAVGRKAFNMPRGKDKPIWGLYEVPFDADDIIVTESIINALTLWTWNYYAISLLGLGTQKQFEMIKMRNWKSIYVAFDGDVAGRNAVKRFCKYMHAVNRHIYVYELPNGKDVNDLSEAEFNRLKIYKYPFM